MDETAAITIDVGNKKNLFMDKLKNIQLNK